MMKQLDVASYRRVNESFRRRMAMRQRPCEHIELWVDNKKEKKTLWVMNIIRKFAGI
jgi:hypothetical protein